MTGADKIKKQFQNEDFILYSLPHVARRVSLICAHEYGLAFGMRVSEWRLLAQISRFGNISAKTLSDRMMIDQVAVSRALRQCIVQKLVREIVNPSDRRSKVLTLTPAGQKFLDRFYPIAFALALRVEQGLSAAEVKTLKSILAKLDKHLRTFVSLSPPLKRKRSKHASGI